MSLPNFGAFALQSPPRRRYVGLDLSLTGTGIATIDEDGTFTTRTIASDGKDSDSLRQRADRLHKLASDVIMAACTADIVCIETPAYNQTNGKHHDRSGLWWLIVDALGKEDLELVEVATTTVKRYATGKGTAAKDTVLANVIRRYPTAPIESNDEADAFVLAAIAARLDGRPVEASLPQTHLEAMTKVRR